MQFCKKSQDCEIQGNELLFVEDIGHYIFCLCVVVVFGLLLGDCVGVFLGFFIIILISMFLLKSLKLSGSREIFHTRFHSLFILLCIYCTYIVVLGASFLEEKKTPNGS